MLRGLADHLPPRWEMPPENQEDFARVQPLFGYVLEYLGNLPDGRTNFQADEYSIEITSSGGQHKILFCLLEETECFELSVLLGGVIMYRRQNDEDMDWVKAIDILATRARLTR